MQEDPALHAGASQSREPQRDGQATEPTDQQGETTVSSLTHITDATFEQEIQGETPVLVDFWAEWCGPCRMVAPVLEQIAAEQGAALRIAKMNVDENTTTPQKFGISGIPTMILFKAGQPVERLVGFMPKPQLMGRLQPHLAAKTVASS
ncbi:MAG: thioredoxin [Chloroflexi bacterium]|nr:thioredoxin [Chloroflexota bacterium]